MCDTDTVLLFLLLLLFPLVGSPQLSCAQVVATLNMLWLKQLTSHDWLRKSMFCTEPSPFLQFSSL